MIIKFHIDGYNPKVRSNPQLSDDWRIVAAKFSTMKSGGSSEFASLADAVNFAQPLYNEIMRRGKITFHPLKMQPHSRELFDIVSGKRKLEKETAPAPSEYPLDYYAGLRDFDKDFVIELSEILKNLEGNSILEIGCGAGRALGVLKRAGLNACGVDTSAPIIKELQSKGLDAKVMNAENLEYPMNSFDSVFSMHTLEHCKDFQKALAESVRVCRKKAIHLIPLGERGDLTHKQIFPKPGDLAQAANALNYAKSISSLPGNVAILIVNKELSTSEPIFDNLDDFIVCPDFISYVGGAVNKTNYNDIDYCYRSEYPDANVELPFRNQFPVEMRSKLHPIPNASGPHGNHIPLYDLVARRKRDYNLIPIGKAEFKPLSRFIPPKTGGGYMLQEFFDIDSFYDKWAKGYIDNKIPLFVEQKYNGWRTILEADAKGKPLIYFEDSKKDRAGQFPGLSEDLKIIPGGVIFDSDLGAVGDDGRPIPRKDLADFGTSNKTIPNQFETTGGVKGSLVAHVFDVIYYNGEDLRSKPLIERRKILEEIFGAHDFKTLTLGKTKLARSKDEVVTEVKKVSGLPQSEGAVIKSSQSEYHFENEPGWAKIKNMLELKAQVLGLSPVKGSPDTFNYEIGYALDGSKTRTGGNIVSMGKTFNSNVKAKVGDILTISVEEVIPVEVEPGKWGISIVAPKVRDIDTSRKAPESTKEIIHRADESGILQASSGIRDKLRAIKLIKAEGNITIQEGDEGEVVFQVHERGLSPEQLKYSKTFGIEPIKLSPEELKVLGSIKAANWPGLAEMDSAQLKSVFDGIDKTKFTPEQAKVFSKVEPVSVHTDFRFRVLKPKGWDYFEGGEGFTPGNQYRPNKFIEGNSNPEIKILGNFKVPQKAEAGAPGGEEMIRGPLVWMDMGLKVPVVFKPGEVGATAQASARLTAIEKFRFKAGVQDKHFKEFWFYGNKISGRWIFTFVPTGPGDRQWMISKPAAQEMKTPDFKKERKIFKDEKKQIVYGVVYEPMKKDTDGDYATAEEIEKACHKFLEEYNSISLMHKDLIDSKAKVVESYIAPVDMVVNGEFIPKGAWVMATHITDPDLWKKIINGELNAYSIEGTGLEAPPIASVERR